MKKIAELIKNSKKAVILPHINADGDAIGSSRALAEMLNALGISSQIYVEEAVEERLSFINRDILIYDGSVCEFDICIVLDCGDKARIGKRAEIIDAAPVTVMLDHHKTNEGFGDAYYVCSDAAATGEIMFDLCKELGIDLTPEIARPMYAAIISDTGRFAYSNVTPRTFEIAGELIKLDIDHAEIARLMFDTVDIKSELIKAELIKRVNSYHDGKIRVVAATRKLCDGFGMDVEDIDSLVDIPRRLRGTEIAIALKEKENCVRVSLRANSELDVARVAAKFAGGGHTRAAGCNINKNIDEAEREIVKACEELL